MCAHYFWQLCWIFVCPDAFQTKHRQSLLPAANQTGIWVDKKRFKLIRNDKKKLSKKGHLFGPNNICECLERPVHPGLGSDHSGCKKNAKFNVGLIRGDTNSHSATLSWLLFGIKSLITVWHALFPPCWSSSTYVHINIVIDISVTYQIDR